MRLILRTRLRNSWLSGIVQPLANIIYMFTSFSRHIGLLLRIPWYTNIQIISKQSWRIKCWWRMIEHWHIMGIEMCLLDWTLALVSRVQRKEEASFFNFNRCVILERGGSKTEILQQDGDHNLISASADGGPRSRVCARETLCSAPHRH